MTGPDRRQRFPRPPRGARVVAYLLNEMTTVERAAFESELLADPELRDEVATLERVATRLGALPETTPAPIPRPRPRRGRWPLRRD